MTVTRLKLQCNECGKRFLTAKEIPYCPKCGGADVDLYEEAPTAMVTP